MSEIAGNDTSRPGPKAPPRSAPSEEPSFAGVAARSMRAAVVSDAAAAVAFAAGGGEVAGGSPMRCVGTRAPGGRPAAASTADHARNIMRRRVWLEAS